MEFLPGISGLKVRWVVPHRTGNALMKVVQAIHGWLHALILMPFTDVVHIHSAAYVSFFRKTLFFMLARLFRRPVVWHLHAPNTDFVDFFGRPDRIGRFARWVLRQAESVVVLSESWIDIASDILPSVGVEAIYNPIPSIGDEPDAAPGDTGMRILYLAHLIPRKGYPLLIEAFAEVLKDFPDARLVFAGSGELNEAKALCEKLGITDKVDYLGWIGEPARTNELRKASVFALPSYQEGLPMGVLEAMAFGLPVVTTPVGGIGDVIEDGINGLLVAPGDSGALANGISRLAADSELRRRIGSNARTSVQSLSPDHIADEWNRLYVKIYNRDDSQSKPSSGLQQGA
jgi:glycosyltransferase involved in cell wall biosynthesis